LTPSETFMPQTVPMAAPAQLWPGLPLTERAAYSPRDWTSRFSS